MARQEKRTGVEINVRQAERSQKEDEGVVGLLHALTSETVGYSTALPLVIYPPCLCFSLPDSAPSIPLHLALGGVISSLTSASSLTVFLERLGLAGVALVFVTNEHPRHEAAHWMHRVPGG